jgi:hypothetical protein
LRQAPRRAFLRRAALFDLYHGRPRGDEKSLAYRLVSALPNATEDEVEAASEAVQTWQRPVGPPDERVTI